MFARFVAVAAVLINSILLLLTSSKASTSNDRRSDEPTEFVSCPSSCFCDENCIYVSCVGDSSWELSFPPIPRTVARLEIRNYNIGTLSLQHLQGMSALQELKLQQTRIDSIANGAFIHLNKLERLDLNDNQIENLTTHAFDGLQDSLRYIDLSSNKLRYIDEAFKKLLFVEQLNLRKNRLVNLTINTFLGLSKLQYLNLDANEIQYIEPGSLILLPNLAHLLLSNNPLSSLSRLDSVTQRLQYVDISNIGLTFIPQGIEPFVRDLRLARNKIKRITSGELDNYSHLSLLVLDDNQIEEIEQDAVGRLEYLIRLWLNGNKLKTFSINLPLSLRELYLEDNLLEVIEASSFKGLVNLERLFLKRNRIHTLEQGAFSDLYSLKQLDLQSNFLENFTSAVFANLTNLESLDLSRNKFKYLSGESFVGMTSLKVLILSHIQSSEITVDEHLFEPINSLRTLELYDSPEFVVRLLSSKRMLQSVRTLHELNIMHNKLKNLSTDFASYFSSLQTIKLSGNSWHCDRNIRPLVEWMQENARNVNFYMSLDVKCSSPTSLQSKPIKSLTVNDLPESETRGSKSLVAPIAANSSTNQIATDSLLFNERTRESRKTVTAAADAAGKRKNITFSSEETRQEHFANVSIRHSSHFANKTKILNANESELAKNFSSVRASTMSIFGTLSANSSFESANGSFSQSIAKIANKSTSDESKSRRVLTTFDAIFATKRERKHISNTSKRSFTSSLDIITDAFTHKVSSSSSNLGSPAVAALFVGCLLVILVVVSLLLLVSKYKAIFGVNKSITRSLSRSLCRRNSVSYCSQSDEVSIATISKTIADESSDFDFVFKNKLYFAVNEETNN
ncbi:insulin-like growth factor-binding protein complex acid labile subunit [Dinothrombium tinctorium]|uniref:Insulin-like growth factor-binding protein complex acid labile subunit n=1 Tax=Dinothrombium tinctorium TaxID=1965070 RepID=A0A3S4RGN9_9ACAR|nr:insulin-like growth factor-binding protein complex acid labile subunit [Dinothrombium tinctorium]